jgi:hypothetical protein
MAMFKGKIVPVVAQPFVFIGLPVSAAQSPSVSVPLPISDLAVTPAVLSQPSVVIPAVGSEVTGITTASMFNTKTIPLALIASIIVTLAYKFGKKYKYGGKR